MQASPYWEIAAGYVGAMRAEIPFTSLYSQAVSLTLDETLITIRPRTTPLETAFEGAADKGPSLTPGMASSLVMLKTRPRAIALHSDPRTMANAHSLHLERAEFSLKASN
jgi:hypothetical protein